MSNRTETLSTYEVEYLVHLNVSYRVESTDEDAAYEATKSLHEGFLSAHDSINENLALTECVGVKRVTKTGAGHIADAIVLYKDAVEDNTSDDYDAIREVINAVRDEDHTPLYEVQETASNHGLSIDLEDENVCRVVWAQLIAMTDLWAFARGMQR